MPMPGKRSGVTRGGECGENPRPPSADNPHGCPQDCGADIACGNGTCDPGEDSTLCPQDCKHNACGNNVCVNGEDLNGDTPCAADCAASCGDGKCDTGETNGGRATG